MVYLHCSSSFIELYNNVLSFPSGLLVVLNFRLHFCTLREYHTVILIRCDLGQYGFGVDLTDKKQAGQKSNGSCNFNKPYYLHKIQVAENN